MDRKRTELFFDTAKARRFAKAQNTFRVFAVLIVPIRISFKEIVA